MSIQKSILFALSLGITTLQAQKIDIFSALEQQNKKDIKAWVKSKPDTTVFNEKGLTPLHAAVETGNQNIVKKIVRSGIAINILDNNNQTALDYAVKLGHKKIVLLLVKQKASVTTDDHLKQTKIIIKQHYKKLMKIFYIIMPILVITSPIWVAPFLVGTLPMSSIIVVGTHITSMTFVGMFSLPIATMNWKAREHNQALL